MSTFNGLNYVSAYFSDDERKTVMTYWEEPANPGELVEIAIEAKVGNDWDELMTYCTMDELHENTWNYIKESEQAFKDQVIDIAKERGWLVNMDDGGTSDFHKIVVDMVFDPYDEEIHKEKLFFLKIQLFEKEFIRTCKDKEAKKKLRRSATPVEAMRTAIEIFDASQEASSQDTSD